MSPKAAIAIVAILINGRPVSLPTPAFLHDGHVVGPVRDVFQQMGAMVRWDDASRRVVISAGDRRVELEPATGTARADGQFLSLRATPIRRGHSLFAPLAPLAEALGARVQWQPGDKTLTVEFPPPEPPSDTITAIGGILAAPEQYDGRPVALLGEYGGWEANPFSFATRHGPPSTRSDWVLRDDTGEIYCSAGAHPDASVALQPRSSAGRRIRISGFCRTSRGGIPYVEPTSVSAVGGLAGLICSIRTEKYVYKPDEPVRMTLTLGNPLAESVSFYRPSAQRYDLVVRADDGTEVWRWSRGRVFAQVVSSVRLEPGARMQFEEVWDQRPNVPGASVHIPARYQVAGIVSPDVKSYPADIEIAR